MDRDAELFSQLAPQAGKRRLVRLELTAGELPTAGHVLAGGTLRDENPAGGVEQRAGDDVQRSARCGGVLSLHARARRGSACTCAPNRTGTAHCGPPCAYREPPGRSVAAPDVGLAAARPGLRLSR